MNVRRTLMRPKGRRRDALRWQDMPATRYPIRIGARSLGLVRILFGATPETAWADVDEHGLRTQFGRFHFATGLENIASWRIEEIGRASCRERVYSSV